MMPPFSVADFSVYALDKINAHPVALVVLVALSGYLVGVLLHKARVRFAIRRQIHQIADLGRKADEAHLAWLTHLREQDAEARRIHRLIKPTPDPKRAA